MIKAFLAKYLIGILIAALVCLGFLSLGLYIRWTTTSGKLDTAIAEKKAVEATRDKYLNQRDEVIEKNKSMSASVERQNEELEARKAEAETRDKEIAKLQQITKQEAKPHIAQSQNIRTLKLGDDECDNLKEIIDEGLKP